MEGVTTLTSKLRPNGVHQTLTCENLYCCSIYTYSISMLLTTLKHIATRQYGYNKFYTLGQLAGEYLHFTSAFISSRLVSSSKN